MHDNASSQKGYVLITLAFLLVVLLGFAALAVDVGMMYAAHTSAQRAADAAALAGAWTLSNNRHATDPAALAITRAKSTAARNTILGAQIPEAEVDVNVNLATSLVTVNLSHTIPTFFAGVLGQKFATVGVVANAEVVPTGKYPCVKPWFIPNNIVSTKKACEACFGSTPPEVLAQYNSVTKESTPTDWAINYINSQGFTPFTVKPGSPSAALGPGDFFAVQYPDDLYQGDPPPGAPGANVYRDHIAYCDQTASTIKCGDMYPVKTGNMIGPTGQGTEILLTDNRDAWNGISGGVASYVDGITGSVVYDSHQIVIAPVWDTCGRISCATCPGPDCDKLNGPMEVTVIGFAVMFIDSLQGNDVKAYLLDVKECGAPGGSIDTPFPIRLVRTE